jgi:hypothetical protein
MISMFWAVAVFNSSFEVSSLHIWFSVVAGVSSESLLLGPPGDRSAPSHVSTTALDSSVFFFFSNDFLPGLLVFEPLMGNARFLINFRTVGLSPLAKEGFDVSAGTVISESMSLTAKT